MFRALIKYLLILPLLLCGASVRAQSGEAPLNYFLHAHGPAAQPTMVLGWVYTGITVAVCVIVALLLLMAILRKRDVSTGGIGREEGGMSWIYIGTGISTAVLFGMMIYALITLQNSTRPPSRPQVSITVLAYDWWWKVIYDEDDPSRRFVTANEIHIPVGVPVEIKLASADVIHAFWVPQLAGKTEMIPGLVNQQWLQADAPGVYRGQCTQFCGLQHAHMQFEVVAQSAADFDIWEEAQRRPALPSTGTRSGQRVFMNQCAACHAVNGTDAKGEHAPDLTHLMQRRLIAAGLLTNTPEHLMDWVAHAQELKSGAEMPDMALSVQEASQLSAYLQTLK